MHIGCDDRCRRIRAHAAGVRAFVVVEQAFVVLAGGERQHVFAITQHDETGFFAFEKLLDHDPSLAVVVLHAELVVSC